MGAEAYLYFRGIGWRLLCGGHCGSFRRSITRTMEEMCMEALENLVYFMDSVLDTKRKRTIVGGILLSAALMFGGLAITALSVKD